MENVLYSLNDNQKIRTMGERQSPTIPTTDNQKIEEWKEKNMELFSYILLSSDEETSQTIATLTRNGDGIMAQNLEGRGFRNSSDRKSQNCISTLGTSSINEKLGIY